MRYGKAVRNIRQKNELELSYYKKSAGFPVYACTKAASARTIDRDGTGNASS